MARRLAASRQPHHRSSRCVFGTAVAKKRGQSAASSSGHRSDGGASRMCAPYLLGVIVVRSWRSVSTCQKASFQSS